MLPLRDCEKTKLRSCSRTAPDRALADRGFSFPINQRKNHSVVESPQEPERSLVSSKNGKFDGLLTRWFPNMQLVMERRKE
jgi:hypothetical protein